MNVVGRIGRLIALAAIATACGRSFSTAARVIERVAGLVPETLDTARELATLTLDDVVTPG